jgi:hypothetical protein
MPSCLGNDLTTIQQKPLVPTDGAYARGLSYALVPTASFMNKTWQPCSFASFWDLPLSLRHYYAQTGQTKVLVHRERCTTMPHRAHEHQIRLMSWPGDATWSYNCPLPFSGDY